MPMAGTRNVVPGTPMTTETTPITKIVPKAAVYAIAGRRSAGYLGRYLQPSRLRTKMIPPRRTRPAGNKASNAHHGWMFTYGRIDARNVAAYPSQYANVPPRRALANVTSRFTPGVHRHGRARPSRTIAPRTMTRKKYRDR